MRVVGGGFGMEPTTHLSPVAQSILDLIKCRGGKIESDDASLKAWHRRTRYGAITRLLEAGLLVKRGSLRDARVWVYEVVSP